MIGGQKDNKYTRYISLGFEIAVGLMAPILIGLWLDIKLDLTPWLTLSGVVVGLVILTGTIVRLARNLNKNNK